MSALVRVKGHAHFLCGHTPFPYYVAAEDTKETTGSTEVGNSQRLISIQHSKHNATYYMKGDGWVPGLNGTLSNLPPAMAWS